ERPDRAALDKSRCCQSCSFKYCPARLISAGSEHDLIMLQQNSAAGMCGRYVIFSTPEAIRALFRYGEQPNFPPRYNIAPTQPIPIARLVDGMRCPDALGPAAVLGRGAENISASHQCPWRILARQAGGPQCHAAAALSDPDRRLL